MKKKQTEYCDVCGYEIHQCECEKPMTNVELLRCPFCDEELEVVGKNHYFAHKINGCILQHFAFETDDQTGIDLWNTRKPMEQIAEKLEKASYYTLQTFDEDGFGNDDSEEVVELSRAIEIVEEWMVKE